MKTSYEKMQKLSKYILDIMYMFKFYNDNYQKIANYKVVSLDTYYTPAEKSEFIRSYIFNMSRPDVGIVHNSISSRDQKSRIITCTGSWSHIKNNTDIKNTKYVYVLKHEDSFEILKENLKDDFRNVYDLIMQGIENNSIREAEFQAECIGKTNRINGAYLIHFIYDHLKMFKMDSNNNSFLALGTTDVLRFIPAHKAMSDLLTKRLGNDWRSAIKNNYGYDVK